MNHPDIVIIKGRKYCRICKRDLGEVDPLQEAKNVIESLAPKDK